MDFLRFCSRIFTFSLDVATSPAYLPAGWSNDKTVADTPERLGLLTKPPISTTSPGRNRAGSPTPVEDPCAEVASAATSLERRGLLSREGRALGTRAALAVAAAAAGTSFAPPGESVARRSGTSSITESTVDCFLDFLTRRCRRLAVEAVEGVAVAAPPAPSATVSAGAAVGARREAVAVFANTSEARSSRAASRSPAAAQSEAAECEARAAARAASMQCALAVGFGAIAATQRGACHGWSPIQNG